MSDRFDEMAWTKLREIITAARSISADAAHEKFAAVLRTVAQEERRKALKEAARYVETHCFICSSEAPHHRMVEDKDVDVPRRTLAAAIRALLDQPTPGETK